MALRVLVSRSYMRSYMSEIPDRKALRKRYNDTAGAGFRQTGIGVLTRVLLG